MAVKFQCPKCGKKYIDWGADKLGFQCPDCKEELLEIGMEVESTANSKPSLKRKKSPATKKKAAAKKKAVASGGNAAGAEGGLDALENNVALQDVDAGDLVDDEPLGDDDDD